MVRGGVRGWVGGDSERERVEHITLPFPADLGTCFSVWRLVMSWLVVISILDYENFPPSHTHRTLTSNTSNIVVR